VSFELDVAIQPLASNATCGAAKPVSPGTMLSGDTSFGGADLMTVCTAGPAPPGAPVSGPLWYSVTVPAGQVLRVNVSAMDPFTPVYGALDGCGAAATCLLPTSRGMPSPTGQLRYANAGATAQNVLFFVGHAPFDSGGRFALSVSVDALASNGVCAAPTPLTDGVAVMGDTTLGGGTSTPCSGPSTGTVYYSIAVPAAETLGVEVSPSGGWPAQVGIIDSCNASSCLGTTVPGPTPATTFTNNSGSPRPVIVAVTATFGGGPFTLTPALRTPPTNVSCAAATAVKNGTSLTFQDASAGVDNLASRCNGSDTGGVLYYSASIGAGQTLTATATTSGMWIPSLRLLASCGAMSCLATSSGPMFKGPFTSLTYLNGGSSPMNVILAVGPSGMFGPPGFFDLSVAIGP
jgi:hypothetical protein